jgi:hypothetical protein
MEPSFPQCSGAKQSISKWLPETRPSQLFFYVPDSVMIDALTIACKLSKPFIFE